MGVSGYPPNADALLPGLSSWMESVRSTLDTVAGSSGSGGPQIYSLQIVQEEDGDVRGVANVNTETVNVRFKADVTDWPTDGEIAAATPVTTGGQTKVTSGVLATLAPGQEVYLGAIAYAADASFSLAFFTRGIPTGVFGSPTLQLTTSETTTLGTLTVVINDPNSLATKVEFRSKQGDSAWSSYNEDVSPPYSADVTMVEGEISRLGVRVTYTDKTGSSVFLEDEVEFRTDATAVVSVPNVTVEGTNGRIDYSGNHYTASIWRKDRGAGLGTAVQVDTGRVATETIALTSSRQDYDAFGKNAAAVAGPIVEFSLPPQQQWGNLANRLLDAVTGGTLQAGLIQDSAGATGIRVDRDDTIPGGWIQYIDLGAISSEPIVFFPGFEILASGETIIKDWNPINLLEANDSQLKVGTLNYNYKQFEEWANGKMLVDMGLKVGDAISFGGECKSETGTDGAFFRLRFWNDTPAVISTHDTSTVTSSTYVETTIENLVIPATTVSISLKAWNVGTSEDKYWKDARLAYAANLPEWQQPPIRGDSEDIINSIMIVAEAIEAGHIAANTITGTHIDSDTITADNIDADTITATEIAAITITGAELAAGAITAGKISAAAIDATNLFVDNIITAQKLQVVQLSTIVANMGLLTAGVIRNADSNFIINLDLQTLVINDNQGTPVNRVQIGKFGSLDDEYGLEIYDANGTLILGGSGPTPKIGTTLEYPSGVTLVSVEPAEADADQTSIHTALNTLTVASSTAADVDTATGRTLVALDIVSDINAGIKQKDAGDVPRALITDGFQFTARDGDAVTFGTPFQDIPVVAFSPGISLVTPTGSAGGSGANMLDYMGLPPGVGGSSTADLAQEVRADALTASGFNQRAKLAERNFTVAEFSESFPGGTITTEGASIAMGTITQDSETDSWRVEYDVTNLEVDSADTLSNESDDLTGTLTSQGQSSQVSLTADPNGSVEVDYNYNVSTTASGGGSTQDSFGGGVIDAVSENKTATLSQTPSGTVTVKWSRVCQAVCADDNDLAAANADIQIVIEDDRTGGYQTRDTVSYGSVFCACEGSGTSETDNGNDSTVLSAGLSAGDHVRIRVIGYTENSDLPCAVATCYCDPDEIDYASGAWSKNTCVVKTWKDIGAGWVQTDSNTHIAESFGSLDTTSGNASDFISGMDQSESVKVSLETVTHEGTGSYGQTITPGSADYQSGGAETATVTLKVAVDSKDGASAWVERGTKTYQVQDSTGSGTSDSWLNEVIPFVDPLITNGDDIRVRIKELSVVGNYDSRAATIDPDDITGDDISGTQTESSMTPLGSDYVGWAAFGST